MRLRVWRGESEGRVVERRRQLGVTSSEEPQCNQARQPFPANFFVTHETSSPSSTSYHRSCSPREFTFHPFFSTTKVCPDLLNLPNAGDLFAGISSLSSCSLFSPTRDLFASI
jgi:hypothetical protein